MVVSRALQLAAPRGAAAARVQHLAGKDRATLGTIKQRMYADVVAALRLPEV